MKNENNKKKSIGPLQTDNHGEFRIIDGKRIGQIEKKDERSQRINDAINDRRASGQSSHDWLLGR